jgi:hypothetical protein
MHVAQTRRRAFIAGLGAAVWPPVTLGNMRELGCVLLERWASVRSPLFIRAQVTN